MNLVCNLTLLSVQSTCSVFVKSQQGYKKNLNSSLSFGQAALAFCLPRVACWLSQLMTLLEDDLPRCSTLRQVIFKSYLPSKKTCLSQTTGHRDVTKISSCWVKTIRQQAQNQTAKDFFWFYFSPIFLCKQPGATFIIAPGS